MQQSTSNQKFKINTWELKHQGSSHTASSVPMQRAKERGLESTSAQASTARGGNQLQHTDKK
jgi:hypothetical protein